MNAFRRSERYLKVDDFRSFKMWAPICFPEFLRAFLPCQTLLKALEEIFYKNRRGVCPELQEFLLMELSSDWIFADFCLFLFNLGDISDRLKVQI